MGFTGLALTIIIVGAKLYFNIMYNSGNKQSAL